MHTRVVEFAGRAYRRDVCDLATRTAVNADTLSKWKPLPPLSSRFAFLASGSRGRNATGCRCENKGK